jgi:hypothetical protein
MKTLQAGLLLLSLVGTLNASVIQNGRWLQDSTDNADNGSNADLAAQDNSSPDLNNLGGVPDSGDNSSADATQDNSTDNSNSTSSDTSADDGSALANQDLSGSNQDNSTVVVVNDTGCPSFDTILAA